MNECSARTETTEDKVETVTARQTAFEQEMLEGYSAQEEATNCVRYGLKEFGGFGRNASLTTEQYRHMLTQERGNFVLWNQRNRADIIDSVVTPLGKNNTYVQLNLSETPFGTKEFAALSPASSHRHLETILRKLACPVSAATMTCAINVPVGPRSDSKVVVLPIFENCRARVMLGMRCAT